MKKKRLLVMSLLTVLVLFSLSGIVCGGPLELPFKDNFNDYPAGIVMNKTGAYGRLGPWNVIKKESIIQLVEGIEGSTGKCVKLEHKSGDSPIWLSVGFKPENKYLRVEVRVRRADVKSSSTWYITRVIGTGGYSAVTAIKGADLCYLPGSGKYVLLQQCKPNTWYTVRMDISFPEKNYDVYIDGKLVKFILPFHIKKGKSANEASSFQIAGALEVEGIIFIDSVSIESISLKEMEKSREAGKELREKMLGD